MNIFTYGSLMVPSIFADVTGQHLKTQSVSLCNHERFSLKNDSYPGIIRVDGKITDGVLYFDVNDFAVEKLDTFEGKFYRRTPVDIVLDDKNVIEAQAYVVKSEYKTILSKEPWSFELFKNNFQDQFKEKYFGFSAIKDSDQ